MKIRFYLALAAAALVMTNCSQDEELVQVKQNAKGFTATIEGASRSTADPETGVFEWTAGDKISVWNGSTFDVYANSEGNESTFIAEDEENAGTPTGYAIYPAGEHTISGQDVTINLPATYAYGSTNAPMLATIEEGSTNLSFKHLAGMMRFVVNNVPAGATSFVFTTTNEILTGSYNVVDEQIRQDGESSVNNNNSVTIEISELATTQDEMVFFVPLPVGTYGKYTVEIKGNNLQGTYTHTSTDVTNTIGRCTMLLMPEFTCTDQGLEKASVAPIHVDGEDVNLSGIQSVTIGTENATQDAELILNYTPKEGNAILNIKDDSNATTSQDSKGKIVINPQGNIPVESLNLNTPSLTAELGAGTYGKVEALTANQTLIIGEGVTIETLVLNGGALQVAEGATIGEIFVKDAVGLKSALLAGGDVTLAAAITLTEMTTIGKDLELDLAGYTLAFEVAAPDGTWPCLKNTATTSIYTSVEGGKIVSNDVGVQNNGTLTINCDIESSSSAINNVYSGKVTIEGGSYSSTADNPWALIAVNSWGDGTPEVIVEDGTFTSYFTNLSFNNGSKGTINGGTFTCTGGWHNIYVGGENGGCEVTYNTTECSFTSNGVNIIVVAGTSANKVNNTDYTATTVLLDYVSTPDELTTAIGRGGNVTLAAAIKLTEMTTIAKDLELDLAGYTLTFEVAEPDFTWPCLKNTATTSIYTSVEGGKIVSNDVGVQNNGILTINCDIESSSSAINNVYSGKVTIEGGSYSSTADNPWALIAVNSWGDGTPEVIVEDGTFTSYFTNLSFNNGSKGTINGGTYTCTGGWHNIYAGGENGGCVVTYDESECNFSSNGQSIYVHNEGQPNSVTSF